MCVCVCVCRSIVESYLNMPTYICITIRDRYIGLYWDPERGSEDCGCVVTYQNVISLYPQHHESIIWYSFGRLRIKGVRHCHQKFRPTLHAFIFQKSPVRSESLILERATQFQIVDIVFTFAVVWICLRPGYRKPLVGHQDENDNNAQLQISPYHCKIK